MRLCTVENCGRPHKGRGYCLRHWQNWRNSGSPFGKKGFTETREAQASMTPAERALYYRWVDLRRSKPRGAGGLVPEWRDSFQVFLAAVGTRPSPQHRLVTFRRGEFLGPDNFEWREGVKLQRQEGEDRLAFRRRYMAARQEQLGTTQLDGQLRKKYGDQIGVKALRAMFIAQKGLCAMCGNPETAKGRTGKIKLLALDHDHTTLKPRGLICQACNHMLGCARDDRQRLLNGVAYLDKHGSKPYPS